MKKLLFLVLALVSINVGAQSSTIKLVVPYAAGGPIDITARILAEKVKDKLGVVIVENKPGAGGNIGAEYVAKASPDGMTIGIAATATHAVNPWLFTKMPYNAEKDFTPITQILRVPNVLVINNETARRLQINNVRDLIAYAKANPGKLNIGSGGNGSAGHLAAEMFKSQAKIFAVHIPYNGANPAQLALLSGQVDLNFDNLATVSANIKAGKIKALAVTTEQRTPLMPEIPAISEILPGFAIDTWWGIVGPAGMPSELTNKLNEAFVAALRDQNTKDRFAGLMAEPVPSTPDQFKKLIKTELSKYEKIVKRSGAKLD
jgi:tripartite-type tricarboxylate transporter receptor subunit TctC